MKKIVTQKTAKNTPVPVAIAHLFPPLDSKSKEREEACQTIRDALESLYFGAEAVNVNPATVDFDCLRSALVNGLAAVRDLEA